MSSRDAGGTPALPAGARQNRRGPPLETNTPLTSYMMDGMSLWETIPRRQGNGGLGGKAQAGGMDPDAAGRHRTRGPGGLSGPQLAVPPGEDVGRPDLQGGSATG